MGIRESNTSSKLHTEEKAELIIVPYNQHTANKTRFLLDNYRYIGWKEPKRRDLDLIIFFFFFKKMGGKKILLAWKMCLVINLYSIVLQNSATTFYRISSDGKHNICRIDNEQMRHNERNGYFSNKCNTMKERDILLVNCIYIFSKSLILFFFVFVSCLQLSPEIKYGVFFLFMQKYCDIIF